VTPTGAASDWNASSPDPVEIVTSTESVPGLSTAAIVTPAPAIKFRIERAACAIPAIESLFIIPAVESCDSCDVE
jgi:hypothetical protein